MNIFRRKTSLRSLKFTGVEWAVHDLLTVFLVTQSRANNIPLFLLFHLELQILGSLDLHPEEISITSLIFQHTSFFAFGGSNAISSIDLSNAYNGITGYNVLGVGALTFISNWVGPIWWASAAVQLILYGPYSEQKNVFRHHVSLLTTFTASSIFFVMLACTSLRTHLFIWTVFSPKFLYSMAWALGQHLCINIAMSSLLYWVGSGGIVDM